MKATRHQGGNRRYAAIFLVVIGAGFLLVTGMEWYARFARYHFELQLFNLPERAEAIMDQAVATYTRREVPARFGGDLSALIGLPHAARPFEEQKPAGIMTLDPQGYVNLDLPATGRTDAVVIGDSFMAVGRMEDIFATRLIERSGWQVKNRAMMGHGPFVSVERFLLDPQFKEQSPRFLIWGFAERELQGRFFKRLDYAVDYHLHPEDYAFLQEGTNGAALPVPFRIHWKSFHPQALKQSLPASSLLAQTSQWIWNRGRYLLFGRLHPDLVPSDSDVVDGPMLFYRHHIDAIRMPDAERDIPRIVKAVEKFDALCRRRGIQLIVVMIPEKEQVYHDWLPPEIRRPDEPWPVSAIEPVEAALQASSIAVVNLLPVFRKAASDGRRLYWRDDTHWSPAGVSMAVDLVYAYMERLSPL